MKMIRSIKKTSFMRNYTNSARISNKMRELTIKQLPLQLNQELVLLGRVKLWILLF